jgi:hypothetical protein
VEFARPVACAFIILLGPDHDLSPHWKLSPALAPPLPA